MTYEDIPVLRGLIADPGETDIPPAEAEVPWMEPATGSAAEPADGTGVEPGDGTSAEPADGTGSAPETGTPDEDGTGGTSDEDGTSGDWAPAQMTVADRAVLTGKHWLNGAAETWTRPGRLFHDLWAEQDESVADYLTYIWQRKFVPPEIEGTTAAIWGWAGIVIYVIFSIPFVLISKAVGVAFKRLLRATLIVVLGYLAVRTLVPLF